MQKTVILLSIVAGILLPSAQAELKRYVDEDGRVIYTNKPIAGNKPNARQLKFNSFLNQSNPRVILYTTAWCQYCKQARNYMRNHGVPYREYDVETSEKGRSDFKKLNGRGVPLILVGDKRMDGFSSTNFEKIYQQ